MWSGNRVGAAVLLTVMLAVAPVDGSGPPAHGGTLVLGALGSPAAAHDLVARGVPTHDDGSQAEVIEATTVYPATPGVTYATFDGIAFRPDANDDGSSKYISGGGISPGAYGWYGLHLDLPQGARVTELAWYVKDNSAANNLVLYLYRFDQSGAGGVALSSATSGLAVVNAIQTVTPPVDVAIDNTTGTYVLYAYSAAADGNLVLYGARVGYVAPAPDFFPVNPTRVYDSRTADGPLASGAERTVSIATKAGASTVVVPPGARAIVVNVTLDQTVAAGFLSLRPAGTTWDQTSTLNWFLSNASLANGTTVKLGGDRQVTLLAGGGGSTHVILDVVGYYL